MLRSLFFAACAAFCLLFAADASAQMQDYDVDLSGNPTYMDTRHFRIHYTLTGEDATTRDFVNQVAAALEKSWLVQVDLLGWPPPPPDGAWGGNALYDVYLLDLTEEFALGITSPEEIIGDNPRTAHVEEWAATSYLMIENDFVDVNLGEGQTEITLMRATVAHEFSHALQFAFDYADAHDWIYEATAVWMETQTMGVDQDATGYVANTFDYPEVCFGSVATAADADRHYGEWLFIDHLAQEFGPDFIRVLWEYVGDFEGFEAVERALESQGTTLEEVLITYRLRNLARDYHLAGLFNATVWLEDTIDVRSDWSYAGVGIEELGANYFALDLEPGVYSIDLISDAAGLSIWSIGVSGSSVDVFELHERGLINAGKYKDLYLMVFNSNYDDDLSECEAVLYDVRIGKGGDSSGLPRLFRSFGGDMYAKLEDGWE